MIKSNFVAAFKDNLDLANDTCELDVLAGFAAQICGVELNPSRSYAEDARRLSDSHPELAEVLDHAEACWYELEYGVRDEGVER
jgi:hypothetical protein